MKKTLTTLIAFAMLLSLTSCAPKAENVELKLPANLMSVGDTMQLEATVFPEEAKQTVTYTSSDEALAIFEENGLLKALAAGTVTVTASAVGGAETQLEVVILPTVTKVNTDEKLTVGVGKSAELTANCEPANAVQDLAYESSKPEIATVDDKGTVTGIATGVADITMTAASGVSAKTQITVRYFAESLTLSHSEMYLTVGGSAKLIATVSPDEAAYETAITFTSNDTSRVTVSAEGVVAAKKDGSATITVKTDNGIEATCKVIVSAKASGGKAPSSKAPSGKGGAGGSGSGGSGGSGGGGAGGGAAPPTPPPTSTVDLNAAVAAGTAHAQGLGFLVSNSAGGASHGAPMNPAMGFNQAQANASVTGQVQMLYDRLVGRGEWMSGLQIYIYVSGGCVYVAW